MKYAFLSLALLATYGTVSAHAADMEKGKTLYTQRCAGCHGDKGAGDGPVAQALPPDQKPRNFQEGGFKFATDDAKMKELFKKGGAGVGLSPLMPPQPDLSDPDLESLVLVVKSLKK